MKKRVLLFFTLIIYNSYTHATQNKKENMKSHNIDFTSVPSEQGYFPPQDYFIARDGTKLYFRKFLSKTESKPVLVIIHGSAGHSAYLESMSQKITQDDLCHVYTPDVRGHGFHTKRKGDVDYIGQLEDDLHIFLQIIKERHPGSKIILSGHSSGGGFALKYANSMYKNDIQALLLLAPYLGHDAPTINNSCTWAQVSIAKLLFLLLLNQLGITRFNRWKILNFNVPEELKSKSITTSYSYRMNANYQTDDYKKDFTSLTQPTLVLVGSNDEAFIAENFAPTIKKHSPKTQVKIIKGHNHMSLITESNINNSLEKLIELIADE